MTTWTSKAVAAALGLTLLGGCSEGFSFAATGPKPSQQVTQVDLSQGQVRLSAPRGYCVSPRSVSDTKSGGFALLARCDMVGATNRAVYQDLALITATTAPFAGDSPPDLEGLTNSAAPAKIIAQAERNGVPMIRVETQAPANEHVSAQHWRAAFVANGQLVGLALYAPEKSAALTDQGADLLADLTVRTIAASQGLSDSSQSDDKNNVTDAAAGTKNSPFKTIAGLFQ
jgi:hypothetical protein